MLEIDAGGLQHVKEQASFLVGNTVGENGVTDFHESQLDGVRVFERRQLQREFAGFRAGVTFYVGAEAVVEVAKRVASHGGRGATDAVVFGMATLGNGFRKHRTSWSVVGYSWLAFSRHSGTPPGV